MKNNPVCTILSLCGIFRKEVLGKSLGGKPINTNIMIAQIIQGKLCLKNINETNEPD